MRGAMSYGARRFRRRAFTFIELIVASIITALVATAGTTLIFATTSASRDLGDIRDTKTAGQYALSQIATHIREARCIGEVTSSRLSLWVEDMNGDDVPNLREMATIQYVSSDKSIAYSTIDPDNSYADYAVPLSVLTSADSTSQAIGAANPQTDVWAHDVESFSFNGYPNTTDTRIVETRFVIGQGAGAVVFETTASPRAPADYLFVAEANTAPPPGSTRKSRSLISPWRGLKNGA